MIKNIKSLLLCYSDSPSTSKRRDVGHNCHDNLAAYPDEAIHQIFLRCDLNTLLAAKQVCRRFDRLINNNFWLEKCQMDNISIPPKKWRRFLHSHGRNIDYLYILRRRNPYSKNVIASLWNEHPDQHAQEVANFCGTMKTNRVTAESPPLGCQLNINVKSCYATSYNWGGRLIVIDLVKLGVEEWILDHLRPRIIVKEWHAPRDDCGSIYELHAQLLKPDEEFDRMTELPRFKKIVKEYQQESGGIWVEEKIFFDDYPVGMRKLAVASRAKCSHFCQGQYGCKFANTTVRIEFFGEPRLYHPSDFPDGIKKYNGPSPGRRGRLGIRRHRMVPDFD